MDGVKNYSISVKKRGDEITFLRRIVRGCADGSYGIDVAKLAGVPDSVVKRARKVLSALESQQIKTAAPDVFDGIVEEEDDQLSFSSHQNAALIEELKTLDVNTLTPLEAMSLLYKFTQEAKEL